MFRTYGATRGATSIVETCARVRADEHLLIVADAETLDVAEAVATAAHVRTPHVSVTIMPAGRLDGGEPPALVSAGMQRADVIIAAVSPSMSQPVERDQDVRMTELRGPCRCW